MTLARRVRRARTSVAAAGASVVAVFALTGCGGGDGAGGVGGGAAGGAERSADAFFEQYVDADGRVVRRDQGGDTVSEGQAYAMLIALASGDRARFNQVWQWTRDRLRRPDGLLSWQWRDGRVVDENPAADADVDAARALVLAGRRFSDPALTSDGVGLAKAVLDHETLSAGDRLVLAAGTWAVARRIVNPSYVAPCAFADLEEATGDRRWGDLRAGSYAMVEQLIAGGRLPPDWARVGDGGRPQAIGSPQDPDGPPRYGLDASRLPFRLAERCDGPGPELAARLWPRLRGLDGGGAAVAYDLDGKRQDDADHPTGLVGAAAAATAAGDDEAAGRLLSQAASLDRRFPTYYGSAWIALGATWMGSHGPKDAP